jgi:phage head maturation protease
MSYWSLTGLRENLAFPANRREVIARTGVSLALVESPSEQATAGVLEGVFARFGEWQEITDAGGHYLERISLGAFRKTIAESGRSVPVLLDHGKSNVLGSLPLGRLESISESAGGVHYAVRLNAGLPELLLAGLRDGQYGSSFRAQSIKSRVNRHPGRSEWNPDGLPEVTRSELRLIDVGPTSQPAYANTTAKVRSLADQGSVRVPEAQREPRPSWQLGPDPRPSWQLTR